MLALQHGDLATAEREVHAALEIKKDVRLAHYNLALFAEERNDPQTAEAEYRKELEAYSDAVKASFNLARLYEKQGNQPAQIAALKQAVEETPNFSEGKLFLSKAYLDAGINFPEAIALARDSLSLHLRPDLAPLAHFVLADLYNRVGRAQDAAREVALGQGRK